MPSGIQIATMIGGESMEFSADKEFFGNYLSIRDILVQQGWKEGKPNRDNRVISVMFTKDGYAMYVVYGCEEEIKNEIL